MAAYNNRSLFSDYYLEQLVQEDSHWASLKNSAWEYRQRISNILEKALPGIDSATPEAEVERRLIRPILDALGHVYFVQPAVSSAEGLRRPDYAFFPSRESLREAESHKGEMDFFKNALAVGDAKAWERSLDKRVKGAGDPFTNHNPSFQIDFYLRSTNTNWGLLTNGRMWRLYQRDLSYRLDVYYEIDLPQILTADETAFLFFLAFFHKKAFEADGTNLCFLDRAYHASTEYATAVSEELRDNVYEALRLLSEGLLAFSENALEAEDLDTVRQDAFIVIYRLLFILYAEARELLPVSNPTYSASYSLRALARDIVTKEPFETKLHPSATGYWSRVRDLFKLIDEGDDFMHIPPYDGRLFDDEQEHQNLAKWKIGDRYLAAAIDQLSRAKAAGRTGRGFVSYRDLSVRELGAIYEGLLEQQPHYASQDMAVVKDDKRETFVAVSQLRGRQPLAVYRAGSVYLETDKGERKGSGSFYTPDRVVKYMVNNTVGPLVAEAKKSEGNVIDKIMSVKVLDIAMGSGHFLVEATDFIARSLVEALGQDSREVVDEDIRWARREVVERCIYGVDLNPLAVDLAKLSLWLSTVSVDKPLNFLDHHLRCGNSLVGARISDLGALSGKSLRMTGLGKRAPQTKPVSMWESWFAQNVATAVDNYFRIATTSSDNMRDIERKEALYANARGLLRRYNQVADIWTSTHFGNHLEPQDYDNLLSRIRAPEAEWSEIENNPWFRAGVRTAAERRFFHWELEFPEAFFDRNGLPLADPGFSAVIGNPPYVNAIELNKILSPYEKPFWKTRFASAEGAYDLYLLFFELGLTLCGERRMTALITPNKFLSAPYALAFREMVISKHKLISLCDCSHIKVFEDPSVYPVISVFERGNGKPGDYGIAVVKAESEKDISGEIRMHKSKNLSALPDSLWGFLLSSNFELVASVTGQSQPLSAVASVQATSTAAESDDFASAIRDKPGPHHKRFINTGLIQRYCCLWGIEPLDHKGRRYAEPYLDVKDGSVSDSRRQLYARPKVIFAKMALCLRGFPDFTGEFASANTNCAYGGSYDLGYLSAVLNSTLMTAIYSEYFGALRMSGGYFQFQAPQLEVLPVRLIDFTTPKRIRQELLEEGKRLYADHLQTRNQGKVLRFVAQRLANPQDSQPPTASGGQADVVHDLLAFLAHEITDLNREKQEEIKGFLVWLESYLGIEVENLKNKTKAREYWKSPADWDEFVDFLTQNRRAIKDIRGLDIEHREPREKIKAEFDKSVARVVPILECIETTDRLIDQVVYKLYGLKAEEIAVVEHSVSM